jgi:hypothetical protein
MPPWVALFSRLSWKECIPSVRCIFVPCTRILIGTPCRIPHTFSLAAVATLGFVEFILYILSSYYDNLDKKKYYVFSNIHFALFYTALLNAFQSVLLAVASTRVSQHIWVQTEMLELNHYVEIREEFDKLEQKLKLLESTSTTGENQQPSSSASAGEIVKEEIAVSGAKDSNRSNGDDAVTESDYYSEYPFLKSVQLRLRWLWHSLVYHIKYPALQRKYNELRLQIGFHEIRVHFLDSYKLPLKLRVSDYLMRSEQKVLIKLVHVSSVAWLLLTGAVNLLYYILGLVSYTVSDPHVVGNALIWIFFCTMAFFVVIAVLVYHKMTSIFQKLMMQRDLWNVHGVGVEERDHLAERQLALFWGGDPKLVIAAIQFMQFGYAVALSVIIIFWEEINDGSVAMVTYMLVIGVCYTIFVNVTAQVIPRYTLCTSLGQLIDQKRLHETLAEHLLEDAKRRQLQRLYSQVVDKALIVSDEGLEKPRLGTTGTEPEYSFLSAQAKSFTEIAALSSELDNLETKPLRSRLPEEARNLIASREMGRANTTKRRKARSEGVALMVAMGGHDEFPSQVNDYAFLSRSHQVMDNLSINGLSLPKEFDPAAGRHERRTRIKSVSDGVALFAKLNRAGFATLNTPQSVPELHTVASEDQTVVAGLAGSRTVSDASITADLVNCDTASLRALLPERERAVLAIRDLERATRRNRRKSMSEGVRAMSAMGVPENLLVAKHKRADHLIVDRCHVNPHQGVDWLIRDDGVSGQEHGRSVSSLDRGQELSQRRGRQKATSEGVAEMAHFFQENTATLKKQCMDRSETRNSGAMIGELSQSASISLKNEDNRTVAGEPTTASPASNRRREEIPHRERCMKQPFGSDSHTSDDASVGSNVSDDGNSDDDDVPEVNTSVSYPNSAQTKRRPPLRDRLRGYFLSGRYVVVSNICGTMVSFFLVGQRVERFLHTQGVVSSKYVSFDMESVYTFWGLMALFSMFVCGDCLMFSVVRPWNGVETVLERRAVIAASLDCVLVSVCIIVFTVAEVQRCCYPDGGSGRKLAGETIAYYHDPAPCDCPFFGSRHYGGLGKVEPYISLVALRIFRQWISKRIVASLEKRSGVNPSSLRSSLNFFPLSVFGDEAASKSNFGGRGHSQDEKGAAAELWTAAAGRYPEIVARYGEFSGELLQAMLGLHVDISAPSDNIRDIDEAVSDSRKVAPESGDGLTQKRFALGKEYSGVAPDAQKMILSGKLGRSVRQIITLNAAVKGKRGRPPLDDEELVFELDSDASGRELGDLDCEYPNAPLVRSMRRCDRMMLPFLDKWTPVDVVLTRFEMVYFEVSDGSVQNQGIEGTKQALSATKGGKGLRLRDVAVGRRAVGHLELSAVESVTVEREMPIEGDTGRLDEGQGSQGPTVEFWTQSLDRKIGAPHRARSWTTIKQDRLKILTKHSHTLYLRFYSDLEHAEHHPDLLARENEHEGPIFKNNAFQWVQTIGRFCGPDQLKQSLPHFGDDTPDELRDYLVVHNHNHAENEHGRYGPGLHLRFPLNRSTRLLQSSNNLGNDGSSTARPGAILARPKRQVRRSSTFGGEGGTTSAPISRQARLSMLRRATSVGEAVLARPTPTTSTTTRPSRIGAHRRSISAGHAVGTTSNGLGNVGDGDIEQLDM